MKLTYEELDSRKLKEAISKEEDAVIEVPSQHADALDLLLDLVPDIKSWPEKKPSVLRKWITLQRAFLLAVRSLFFHAQLVELLPALLSSQIEARRSRQPDGSVVLVIGRK
jgi:hypothetical protein